jgi:hypothetical protein
MFVNQSEFYSETGVWVILQTLSKYFSGLLGGGCNTHGRTAKISGQAAA